MHALFVHDARYFQKDGAVYTEVEFSYDSTWAWYLQFFDHLTVIGRHVPTPDTVPENYNRCSGPNVDFALYPNLSTIKGQLIDKWSVSRQLENQVRGADAIIMRSAQENAWLVAHHAWRHNVPVLVEGTGCPWDNTWNYGSVSGKLYAPIRWYRARKVYGRADYVLYVTQHFLQNRYPTRGRAEAASDVQLPPQETAVRDARLDRIADMDDSRVVKIGLIGPVHHHLKGIDTALKALHLLKQGADTPAIELHILGRGDPSVWAPMLKLYGLDDSVVFDEVRPHEQVLEWLDDMDIYIQPSRHEGMPRAVIEAMARGLPVIASTAGDMPRLIDNQWLIRPGDKKVLARQLQAMLADHDAMRTAGRANFERAGDFERDKLQEKRIAFFQEFADFAKRNSNDVSIGLDKK